MYTRNIAALAESVCEAPSTRIHRHSQQLNILETSLRRSLQLQSPVGSGVEGNWPSVFASDRLTEDAETIFSDEQAKVSHLGHRKPARIH